MSLSTTIDSIYQSVGRVPSAGELADCYQAADRRGLADLTAGKSLPDRPVSHLSSAITRTIDLIVAVHLLHVLPARATDRDADGIEILQLFSTIDEAAAGALHRCQLALEALGPERQDPLATAEEWLPYVYDEAVEELQRISLDTQPPGLIDHAEQSGRDAARAIDHIDAAEPTAAQTIADCLTHLLVVCAFADAFAGRQSSS